MEGVFEHSSGDRWVVPASWYQDFERALRDGQEKLTPTGSPHWRLRYLIGRYGYSTKLLAWQFFNEIDNVYEHLSPSDVVDWHRDMGDWLNQHDPYQHLVTTSLTGGSDRAAIWQIPQMDFVALHSYGATSPVTGLSEQVQAMRKAYQKPVLIGEFGVDWQGRAKESDPYGRGFRQILWTGLVGGSAGSAMSWWWQDLHDENIYPTYAAMTRTIAKTEWPGGNWEPIPVQGNAPPPPEIKARLRDGDSFSASLILNQDRLLFGWQSHGHLV